MARNIHPEKTISLILDVSLELFNTKGYDNTTIQDIVDNLGGLSKGAVYHHFKSKKEIFEAVTDRIFVTEEDLQGITNRDDLNGLEKIRLLLDKNVTSTNSKNFLKTLKVYLSNPEFLVQHLKNTVQVNSMYVSSLLQEANDDGSFVTDYPREIAEVTALLLNIWINPAVFELSEVEVRQKLKFIQHLFILLGADIFDDELLEKTIYYMEDIFVK